MAEILSPGVYVEEVATQAQVIPGVTTSTMGIAGYALRGPANVATLVQSYEQYSRVFGGLVRESFMGLSMAAFFANGGRRAYVVRVPPADATSAGAKIQSVVYSQNVGEGNGSEQTIEGSLETAEGAAPVVIGSASVKWRVEDGSETDIVLRSFDNTTDVNLVPSQNGYTGRVFESLPPYDPELDQLIRGTVSVDFTVSAVGPVSIAVPVGSSSIVQASAGNSTNGASVTVDHKSGIISLKLNGTYVPVAGVSSQLQLSAYTSKTALLEVNTAGVDGNDYSLEFVAGGAAALSNVGDAWTYTFVAGTTTMANFEAAVIAAQSSGCPFSVVSFTAGTLAAPADEFGPENFSGGSNADDGVISVNYDYTSSAQSAEDCLGFIQTVDGAAITDGENIVIDDGINPAVTLEFDNNGGVSNVAVPFNALMSSQDVRDALIAAINALPASILAVKAVASENVNVGSYTLKLLPKTNADFNLYLSTTSTCVVGPLAADAGYGIWVGEVDQAQENYINYANGDFLFDTYGSAPHNKSAIVAAFTKDAWSLSPVSVGAWGNDLRVQVSGSANYFTASTGAYSRFDVVISLFDAGLGAFNVVEQYEELDFSDPTSAVYFADVINELSDFISVAEPAGDVPPTQLNAVGVSQVIAGGDATTVGQAISASLQAPVAKRSVSITYIDSVSGATKTIVDNGSGSLTGAVNGVNANSINYVTGAVSFSTASPIKANSLVIASYAEKAVETVHAERFGDSAKNYAVGVEGTFNDANWGRNQFTEVSALASSYKGIYAFNKVDDILQVVLPDFAGNVTVTGDLLDYAYSRTQQPSGGDRFIILTTPKGYDAEQAKDWFRYDLGKYSDYAALYWPWVRVSDPLANGRPLTMPPLAHIAGIYARTDNNKNVGKAPGGTVDGALQYLVGLETNPTLGDRDIVYQNKINPLISSPQTGLAVWGVRTISNVEDWKYIQARRLFMFLEKSVYNSTWWSVFENNGPLLWSRISGQIGSFMNGLFSSGYLAGANPSQAYFVVCDGTNNPPDSVNAGYVVIDIGAAPNKPAEFVRLRFQQKSLTA
jgi:phage tail sheath protein FI